jgi:hypothetical protein
VSGAEDEGCIESTFFMVFLCGFLYGFFPFSRNTCIQFELWSFQVFSIISRYLLS